jgi:hypothetical protein
MSRVAIVGVEGSGKTVLMAALADRYGTPSDDSLYLMPESQSSFTFMKHIPHKMRAEHQWPAATTIESFKHLKWSVRIGPEVLLDLDMLDYPGELYRMAFGERAEDEVAPHRGRVHAFLDHLVTADVLVVLFNLQDAMDVGENTRNTEAVWLTRGIFDYAKRLPNIKRRLLLFTQADRYQAELTGKGGLEAARDKFLPMMRMLFPDLECAAVSVATDAGTAPSAAFSDTFGVDRFMDWLSSNGTEAFAVLDQLNEMSAILDSGKPLDADALQVLISRLNSLAPNLCKAMAPGMRERLLKECAVIEKKQILGQCDALRENIESRIGDYVVRRQLDEYKRLIEELQSRAILLCSEEEAHIQEHADLLKELTFIKGQESKCSLDFGQRLFSANWRPLYHDLKSDVSREYLRAVQFDCMVNQWIVLVLRVGIVVTLIIVALLNLN